MEEVLLHQVSMNMWIDLDQVCIVADRWHNSTVDEVEKHDATTKSTGIGTWGYQLFQNDNRSR